MKILAAADAFSPLELSGTMRHFLGVASALVGRGHSVDAVLPCPDDAYFLERNFPGIGFEYYNVSTKSLVTKALSTFKESRFMFRQLCSAGDYNLVYFNQPLTSAGPITAKKVRSVPSMYVFHSPWALEYRIKTGAGGIQSGMRHAMEKRALKSVDMVVVLSEFMKGQLLSEHPWLNEDKIFVIPGGVDADRFKPIMSVGEAREKTGLPGDRIVLFTARGLKPRTGVDILIDAMPDVLARHSDVVLSIAGSGPLKDSLKGKVNALGLNEHIRFEGFVDEPLLPVYYQAADIFLLPTRALEGFGLVITEALSCGTPVIGTPVGAIPEVLNPLDPGLIAAEISPAALSERINYWLDNRKRLEEVRSKCRDYVLERYTWDRVVGDYEDMFSKMKL
ncbi:MAG TPA: glycosyltransferase family 4 protein [bacterium]|nr:glycosyltransferase family 4 protein [bacterium]